MAKPPALEPQTLEPRRGSSYPEIFRTSVAGREKRALGDALGLTAFGVNLTTLPPGVASALRHWHALEDEFVYVLEGEIVLETDAGAQTLRPGDCAGFPAGKSDGHRLINRSDRPAVYLEVGDRKAGERVFYSDVDLQAEKGDGGRWHFTHRDGHPY